jgi:hypothetical protein
MLRLDRRGCGLATVVNFGLPMGHRFQRGRARSRRAIIALLLYALVLSGCAVQTQDESVPNDAAEQQTAIDMANASSAGPLIFAATASTVQADDQEVETTFSFSNAGSEPIEVQGISKSCSCADAKSDRRRYEAKQRGTVTARFNPSRASAGTTRYFLQVEYESIPTKRFFRQPLTVVLVVRPRVRVYPDSILLTAITGLPASYSFRIVTMGDPPIRVTAIDSSLVGLSGTIVRVSKQEPTILSYAAEARIDGLSLAPGQVLRESLWLHTDSSTISRVVVPIEIRVSGRVLAMPPSLFLRQSSASEPADGTCVLRDSQGAIVDITDINSDSKDLRAAIAVNKAKQAILRVTVSAEAAQRLRFPIRLRVRCKAPASEEVPVKVVGLVR